MPFAILRNDLTVMQVDAIVNAASSAPVIGSGVETGIYQQAGPALLEERRKIGFLSPGQAALSPGFGLAAHHVIHAVGPVWNGGTSGEAAVLRRTYDASLELTLRSGCESVAFPLLSAGNHGFPPEKALEIAVSAFRSFLKAHEMQIYLVVFSRRAVTLSKSLVDEVRSYIDETYVRRKLREETVFREQNSRMAPRAPVFSVESVSDVDWDRLLRERDAGFSETLVALIERSGRKNAEVYRRANIDKKLFSKIINNVNYHPSKQTALALAIALELNLEETEDLIGRAGYTLTHSSRFDIIVEYFIKSCSYDLFEINEVLFKFDQKLLGV